MQVNTVGMTQVFQSNSSSSKREGSLSLEQQTLIEETLAQYDASSLTEADALAIVETFSEAGIEPSKEFASALSSLGFDAKEIGDLAGISGNGAGGPSGGGRPAGGPPPPPPSDEEVSSVTDLLEILLSSDDEDDSSTSSTSIISSLFSGTGYDDAGTSFETVLDYTSKIVRLKEDARSDVMSMLNEFNTDEMNFQDEQLQKNLLTNLSEVLSKQENYNTISFYA